MRARIPRSGITIKKTAGALIVLLSILADGARAQQLPAKWEELTAEDFVKALQTANNTCALPFGILEKHGLVPGRR